MEDPEVPFREKPEEPSREKPEKPFRGKPEEPSREKPEKLFRGKPEEPSREKPERPAASEMPAAVICPSRICFFPGGQWLKMCVFPWN
jgi:hypothetical protein